MSTKLVSKVAIIGGGASGLFAGYVLSPYCSVTLYERSPSIGGNIRTTTIISESIPRQVHTGFSTFVPQECPTFSALLSFLNINAKKTNIDFSVTGENDEIEYNSQYIHSLYSLFDSFHPHVRAWKKDIKHFYDIYPKYVKDNKMSMASFLANMHCGKDFELFFLQPLIQFMARSSFTDPASITVGTFFRFMRQYGILPFGGESCVLENTQNLTEILSENIRVITNANITVERALNKVFIRNGKQVNTYDKVIFACHPQQILSIMPDIEDKEKIALTRFAQNKLSTTLHSSMQYMPSSRENWACYNYKKKSENISYVAVNLSKIQSLSTKYPLLLSYDLEQKPEFIYDEHTFYYPKPSTNHAHNAELIYDMQDYNNCYYCGSYLGDGNIEDAVRSALSVCNKMEARAPWQEMPLEVADIEPKEPHL